MGHKFEVIEKTLEETNHVLSLVENHYGWKGQRNQSYEAVRVILHVLRDRMTIDQVALFSNQLPLLMRGVYYEGWKPSADAVQTSGQGFVEQVREKYFQSTTEDIEDLISVVFGALIDCMDPEGAEIIKRELPEDVSRLLV
jgi:uncharacterized protein (DUF2267 family)